MRLLHASILGLCVVFLAAPRAQAQEQPRRPGVGAEQLGGPLVGKEALERLKLTGEQREKIAKIENEFAAKAKDNEAKLRDEMQKARQDQDRAALRQLQDKLADARKVRAGYVSQVAAVLTDEQKRAFEQPAAPGRRPGGDAAPSGLLPGALQERLGLSAEQKAKLQQLQKEFESKSLQVLTEEQRQKYEQFKKGRTRQPETPRRPAGASRTERAATPPILGRSR